MMCHILGDSKVTSIYWWSVGETWIHVRRYDDGQLLTDLGDVPFRHVRTYVASSRFFVVLKFDSIENGSRCGASGKRTRR